MFDSIGWGEVLVLIVAGLFVLGPERLPGAAAWLGRSLQQARSFVAGATAKAREDLGPEFEELRRPVAELRRIRGRDPRRMAVDALLRDSPPGPGPGPGPGA